MSDDDLAEAQSQQYEDELESLQKENTERSEIDKAQCKLIQKLRAQLAKCNRERLDYEKLANEWMHDYDKLKEKYEPTEMIFSD